MEKLILYKQRKRTNESLYRVRVTGEAYTVVEKMAEETNLSMAEVCTKMILFAAAHCEIKED